MKRTGPLTTLLLAAAGGLALTACSTPEESVEATTAPETEPTMSIPGGAFNGTVAEVPEVDPAPFASSLIFPEQPGLQFTGPDGTFCEMYGTAGGQVAAVQVMCTHQGEGDINAVVLQEGEPSVERNLNRIFIPHEKTQALQPGQRITDGPVSCAVPEGEIRVMCAITPYSFAVSKQGLDLS